MAASSFGVKRISIALEHKSVESRLIRVMTKQLILLTLLFCAACSRGSNEAHYAELESNRQKQAAEPAPSTAVPSPSPSASVVASPGETAAAPAAPSRNYWTNFRGPRRDGKYEEAILDDEPMMSLYGETAAPEALLG